MLNSYRNTEAIRFLASQADTDEAGTSSHWQKMHGTFQYRDGNFYGLQGFGTLTPPIQMAKRSGTFTVPASMAQDWREHE